jgi:regulator of sirC expression with transglutaminase-like and TPR domain
LPSFSRFEDDREFRRLLQGESPIDLAQVALEFARDAYPRLEPEPYLARIDALADRARERCATVDRPRLVVGQINWVLFVEEGFHGNTEDYHDARNSYLNDVLDRKTGIPITLSVLYLRIAERLGLGASGVNLPAHFVLRVDHGGETLFVDPFHAGAVIDGDGCRRLVARLLGPGEKVDADQLRPCPATTVAARMLRNLKVIHFQQHDYMAALPVQRRLAALRRDDPEEQRDLGMLYLRLDRPADALEPLQAYLDAEPRRTDAEEAAALIRAAKRAAAMRN